MRRVFRLRSPCTTQISNRPELTMVHIYVNFDCADNQVLPHAGGKLPGGGVPGFPAGSPCSEGHLGLSTGRKAGESPTTIFQEISRHGRFLGDPGTMWWKQIPVPGILRGIEIDHPDQRIYKETTEDAEEGA